jgi:valyl-tRNA synthetase
MGNMRLLVPMAGLIDVDAERSRLDKQRARVMADLSRSRGKLGNRNFVNNAPAAVVNQEKDRATEFEHQLAQLDEQLARLDTLG